MCGAPDLAALPKDSALLSPASHQQPVWLDMDSSSSLGTQRPPIAWGPVSLMGIAALCPGLGAALCSLPRRNEFILPIAGTACADSRVLPSDLITHKPAPARDALDASRGCLGPFGLLLPRPLNKRNLYLTVLEARSSMSGCQPIRWGPSSRSRLLLYLHMVEGASRIRALNLMRAPPS